MARHEHAPLNWRPASERPVPIDNQPMEMLAASGFTALMEWIGWCPTCGEAVEWASDDPREQKSVRKELTVAEQDQDVQLILERVNRAAQRRARRMIRRHGSPNRSGK